MLHPATGVTAYDSPVEGDRASLLAAMDALGATGEARRLAESDDGSDRHLAADDPELREAAAAWMVESRCA